MNLQELKGKEPQELLKQADKLGIENPSSLRKQDLMFAILKTIAEEGTAIILISSELPEILSLSHRIIVMREGKITKILNNKEATQENIMSYAIN